MAAPALKYNRVERVSVEEYLRLEEAAETKHEYVNGEVLAMAGASREHNQIVSNLIREIGTYLKGKGCDIFPSDFRVTTPAQKSYFYPDATVACGPLQLQPNVFDTLQNPAVIFEVMSEGTEDIDRGYKFFHYQKIPSLQEYILIDSRQYAIEVIRRQGDDAWKFEKFLREQKAIVLESIDCTLSFDDIYYRVQLTPAS